MKRQRIRNLILFISFLLFPITQFYFSPFLIIVGSSMGIITASFLVFLVMLLAGVFFGRAMCGWIMPCGGLQEICFGINDKPSKGKKSYLIKYFVWIPWLLIIAGAAIQYGGYKTIDPFFAIDKGVSISEPWMFIIYYAVILLVASLALIFGKRSACRYICWMSPFMVTGRKIRNLLGLSALQLTAKTEKCVGCGMCTTSCPMSLDVRNMVNMNNVEHSECILCGKCADACKNGVLRLAFGKPAKVREKQ